jgi:misacylated tRNA(Ala) deacylase
MRIPELFPSITGLPKLRSFGFVFTLSDILRKCNIIRPASDKTLPDGTHHPPVTLIEKSLHWKISLMTLTLYQTDSYLQNFEAEVAAIDEENHAIILNQTAFYPGGGGQPSDSGTLNHSGTSFLVSKVKKVGAEVLHFIDGDMTLPSPGSRLTGQIDWQRRYQLMRTHSALHVLCGVVFRDYGALVTGGDMDPMKGRMDFEFETMQRELVQEIEMAINLEVKKSRPIKVQILPRDDAFQIPDLIRTKINLLPEGITHVRTVEIIGLDLQADGGTHVGNTSEIGRIKVVDYKSKGKINKRIYIAVE